MLICADANHIPLAFNSVNCVVTSPPYWGLRDYGVPGQIGLEHTPEDYVQSIRAVFLEVWRVLKSDGTVWLNLGDSYASGKGTCYNPGGNTSSFNVHLKAANVHPLDRGNKSTLAASGLKPKDLVGIPWMVAFALRGDGWYLRSDIIWAKPNPMPESVSGSHYSRHMVTIEEYERLSGLRYEDECAGDDWAGDDWAGDMPSLSEREIFSRKAPLSAEQKRNSNSTRQGATPGRKREKETVQQIAIRQEEQGQVRGDGQGSGYAQEGSGEISGFSESEDHAGRAAPADKERSGAAAAASESEQKIQDGTEREGALASSIRQTQGRDFVSGVSVDGGGLAGDCDGAQIPLLLLQKETQTHDGSCHPAEQGRRAYESQYRPSLPAVQLGQEQQDDSALLVGCPGCQECLKYHGYIFHLSAGRPTKSHEYLFLLTKSHRYYYDADAIAEKAVDPESFRGRNKRNADKFASHDPGGLARTRAGFQNIAQGKKYETKNRRSVWTINSQPTHDAHFATFPEKLVELCILAGCPNGGVVLDPFCGSGTVVRVAKRFQRVGIGCDLTYQDIAKKRTRFIQKEMVV